MSYAYVHQTLYSTSTNCNMCRWPSRCSISRCLILRTTLPFYLLLYFMRITIPNPPPRLPPSKTCAWSPDRTEELPGCRFKPLNIPVFGFKSVRAMNASVVFGTGFVIWLGLSTFRHIKGANASTQLKLISLTSLPHASAILFLFSGLCHV